MIYQVRTVHTIVRKPHSCGHNDVVQSQSIDIRRSVLLDLTAAFDTIDHNTMLRWLSGNGLSVGVLVWLTSYLYDRANVVRVKSGVSVVNTITTGVSQSTVLGPLMFNDNFTKAQHSPIRRRHSTLFSHQSTIHKPSRVWKPAYKMQKDGSVITDL